MSDGKVINAIENITWSHVCYLCKIGGVNLNSIDQSITCTDNLLLKYGIQPLHLYICSTEFCLNIAYKIGLNDLPKEQRNIEISKRKKIIHDKIFNLKGLNIDVPSIKMGRTTDGNMAR